MQEAIREISLKEFLNLLNQYSKNAVETIRWHIKPNTRVKLIPLQKGDEEWKIEVDGDSKLLHTFQTTLSTDPPAVPDTSIYDSIWTVTYYDCSILAESPVSPKQRGQACSKGLLTFSINVFAVEIIISDKQNILYAPITHKAK